jgi:uncharacterized protein (DUF433 family)
MAFVLETWLEVFTVARSQRLYNHCMQKHPVTVNPKVMHGTPCFAGTGVPVRSLFDHLEGGYNVE